MSPSRGVRWCALLALVTLATSSMLPGVARSAFDDSGPLLQDSSDPLARSPRLLGMGRLGFVLDDVHNRINLWDLGQNPVGVLTADTLSTIEFAPTTDAASTLTEAFGVEPTTARQTYAARDYRTYYEMWRRTAGSTYGAVGDFGTARADNPYGTDAELRRLRNQTSFMPILAGHLPLVRTERLTYALRGVLANPSVDDEYRAIVRNRAGGFIDLNGEIMDSPDFFVPDETNGRTAGVGAHLGLRVANRIQAAAGYDFVDHKLRGDNTASRHASEVREERPYHVGQATIVGSFAGLEWGVDAQGWRSKSHQSWFFTTSAGSAVDPLDGRGKLLDREEEGSSMRVRVRWTHGAFEAGGGFSSAYRQVEIIPPALSDVSSLNHFLNVVFFRTGADTLALPDSVIHNLVEDRSWGAGGGLAWRLPRQRAAVGIEGHAFQSLRGQGISGLGPKQLGWDVRSGLEFSPLAPIQLRLGYIYRWEDRDDFTEHNEFLTHSATAGLGYHPALAKWQLDAAYAYEWTTPDYPDPSDLRASRQSLVSRLRWSF